MPIVVKKEEIKIDSDLISGHYRRFDLMNADGYKPKHLSIASTSFCIIEFTMEALRAYSN